MARVGSLFHSSQFKIYMFVLLFSFIFNFIELILVSFQIGELPPWRGEFGEFSHLFDVIALFIRLFLVFQVSLSVDYLRGCGSLDEFRG